MRSVRPLRLLAFAIPFAIAPMVFAANVPWWVNEDYRVCMGIAAETELDARIDLYEEYHNSVIDDLRSHRRGTRAGWEISDETQRKTFLKQVDREYATFVKSRQSLLTDRLKALKETRTDTESFCKQRQTEWKKFAAGICTSTADCSSGKVCTTEQGACNPSCPAGSRSCVSVCAGTCVKP